MQDLKISLITVVYNAQNTIDRCINSVLRQKFNNVQYIVIDGGSTDDTCSIIDRYREKIDYYLSEPDNGVYDAMNKGIALATGDIIGMLNADDYFADDGVLPGVAAAFESPDIDILYGDLDYVDLSGRVIRKWRSGNYSPAKFNWGWMPPHPTVYCRKALFEAYGTYRLDYGSAADYELMLRFMHKKNVKVFYLNKVMVKMITGGMSNRNLGNRGKAGRYDLKAMRVHGVRFPLLAILFKPLRKIIQFI